MLFRIAPWLPCDTRGERAALSRHQPPARKTSRRLTLQRPDSALQGLWPNASRRRGRRWTVPQHLIGIAGRRRDAARARAAVYLTAIGGGALHKAQAGI